MKTQAEAYGLSYQIAVMEYVGYEDSGDVFAVALVVGFILFLLVI